MLSELEAISIDDIRKRINYLIEKGYDKKVPERRSEQEILAAHEISSELVGLIQRTKTVLNEGITVIEGASSSLNSLLNDFRVGLQPHLNNYMSKNRSNVESSAVDFDKLFEALNSDHSANEDTFFENYGVVDSDEEALLYEELDNLMEAQERAQLFRGNNSKFIANAVQKVLLRIQELESAFGLVSLVSFYN